MYVSANIPVPDVGVGPTELPSAEGAAVAAIKARYREGMARLGAAVNLVTTDGPGGRAGFTASAVCSVTDMPPTLLVCLNRSASVYETFKRNRVLCVNTLAHGQEGLSQRFGGKTPMDERFAAAEWRRLATGAPALVGAVAAFDGEVTDIFETSTHDVLFCKVLALEVDPGRDGLVYFARRYHGLSAG